MNQALTPEILTALPGPIGQGVVDSDHRHTSTSYIKVYPLVVDLSLIHISEPTRPY